MQQHNASVNPAGLSKLPVIRKISGHEIHSPYCSPPCINSIPLTPNKQKLILFKNKFVFQIQ